MKKRTEITLRVKQTLVIKSTHGRVMAWCADCAQPSQMLTLEEIAVLSELSARTLYRQVEEGKLHFIETEEGLLFICLASLEAVL